MYVQVRQTSHTLGFSSFCPDTCSDLSACLLRPPSSKERPTQSPPPTRLRRRAVAPAAVRCVQFSGAWRVGLGDLGPSRSRGCAGPGPAWRPPPGWACSGHRPAPALSHELAQACVPRSGRLPPVPGAWRRAALEGRSVGGAGKTVPSCPETGRLAAGWAEGKGPHSGWTGTFLPRRSLPRGGPGGSAPFSGHPDAVTGTFLCRVGEVRGQLWPLLRAGAVRGPRPPLRSVGVRPPTSTGAPPARGPECVRRHPRVYSRAEFPLLFMKFWPKRF